MIYLCRHSVQTRLPQALVLDTIRNSDLLSCAQLLLRLVRNIFLLLVGPTYMFSTLKYRDTFVSDSDDCFRHEQFTNRPYIQGCGIIYATATGSLRFENTRLRGGLSQKSIFLWRLTRS